MGAVWKIINKYETIIHCLNLFLCKFVWICTCVDIELETFHSQEQPALGWSKWNTYSKRAAAVWSTLLLVSAECVFSLSFFMAFSSLPGTLWVYMENNLYPGIHCAIVSCPARNNKKRGLTFHKCPLERVINKWRSADSQEQLDRFDKRFNVCAAGICSG